MNGYIVKGIGGFYYVKTPDGIVECKPRGIFRKQKITPVAGDEVTLETENGASVIAQIAPRKNVFVRPPVANLDVLFLVASTTQPTPSTLVLDKLSAIAVDKGVQPVIVCTKGDLAEAEFLRSAYEKSTLPFIRIDYSSGAGLDEVKQWISHRFWALSVEHLPSVMELPMMAMALMLVLIVYTSIPLMLYQWFSRKAFSKLEWALVTPFMI